MKKGISIVFALAMLLSVAQVTIATHYCGGSVADTRVSLSGKLASCGMESNEKNRPQPGNNLTKHCCEDQLTTIGICNIFTSVVSDFTDNIQNLQHISVSAPCQSSHSNLAIITFYTSISPPGGLAATSVKLDDICVFRI
jgi:hypothetical protein